MLDRSGDRQPVDKFVIAIKPGIKIHEGWEIIYPGTNDAEDVMSEKCWVRSLANPNLQSQCPGYKQ